MRLACTFCNAPCDEDGCIQGQSGHPRYQCMRSRIDVTSPPQLYSFDGPGNSIQGTYLESFIPPKWKELFRNADSSLCGLFVCNTSRTYAANVPKQKRDSRPFKIYWLEDIWKAATLHGLRLPPDIMPIHVVNSANIHQLYAEEELECMDVLLVEAIGCG